ncbi:hypothetical protein DFH08DRAFT_976792 [Mycena albidolilacea]|uniref:Uncharacterized protein n=1 Tax=Mycena albidolilacea TaxID=1033008 RepID=A0AAD7EA06_9AGAR|nr:hypothetical protein DFH08DRAFT_976792 [Mycena albidolilacea]
MQGLYDETAQVFAVQSLSSIHRLASVCTDVRSRNPIARCRDEAQWPYRSRLPARTISPLPPPMMPWPPCLVYCPIRVILPDPLLRLPTRILTGDETFPRCGSCSLALKGTSTASTTPRARAQPRAPYPSIFHRLKARFPPRTSAARTVASPTVPLPYAPATPSIALGSTQTHRFGYRSRAFYPEPAPCTSQLDAHQQHRTLPTHIPARLTIDGATLSRPSRPPPRDLSAVPPMHAAAASIIVCSRRDGWGARAMGNAPPIALAAPPRRWGRHHKDRRTRKCVRRGTTPAPPRNDMYVVANTGVANGSHAARTRAGAIRAKANDERRGHFHGRPTHGSTTTSRSRMRMSRPPLRRAHNSLPHPAPWSASTSAR